MSLEVPARVRGEGPMKLDVKLTGTAEITYHGVGPDGAKPTEGYHARVWLQEGSTDTATKVITLETGSNDRADNMQAFAKTALELLLRELSG